MKGFWKNVLVVLVLGIILTCLISFSETESDTIKNQNSIQETIGNLEDDIEAGIIIKDGNIEGDEDEYVDVSNNLGTATNKVGNIITSLVCSILEFFAKLFGSLLS